MNKKTRNRIWNLAQSLSLVYGLAVTGLGVSYLVQPGVSSAGGAGKAVSLVLPIWWWGWIFVLTGALNVVGVIVQRFQHIVHLFSACLWAFWTMIVVTATIFGLVNVGAPFIIATLFLAHVALAVYYRPVKIPRE